MKKKTSSNTAKIVTLSAGIASLAAASYFFLGPKGKKHQQDTKAWAIKMKGDVVAKLKKARAISEPVYHKIIDSVATEYAKRAKAGRTEIHDLAIDLKKHWKTLSGVAGIK